MGNTRLVWRLFLSYLALILITLIVITWYGTSLSRDFFVREIARDLEEKIKIFREIIIPDLQVSNYDKIDSLANEIGLKSNTRFTVILSDGIVIGDSGKDPEEMENHRNRPEVIEALQNGFGTSVRFSHTLNLQMIYVAIPLNSDNENIGILRGAVPLTSINNAFKNIEFKLLIAGILTMLFAALVGFFISRKISKPLESIEEGIEKFAQGSLDYRLPPPSEREFNRLAIALNQMADQINEKINQINEQKLEKQTILESMIEGVLAIDVRENLISMNNAAARLFQVNAELSIGKNILEVTNNADLHQIVAKTLQTLLPQESEIIIQIKRDYYLQVHCTALKDAQNKLLGALIVLNDVTRLRRLENVRRDFVANVSHEIKTPLTSIKGYVETLIDGAISEPENARSFLQIISKQADRLNAIIEDLLTLARLEQEEGQKGIDLKPGRINEVVKSAINTCIPFANARKITIQNHCDNDIKALISAPLLEQAIINLIDNAIKYSPENSEIKVDTIESDKSMSIRVFDQGQGIDARHLPRLFERFYRVDKARSRNMGGTGLGLAIVKHIAQVHKGTVHVESEADKGSTFFLTLPKVRSSQTEIKI